MKREATGITPGERAALAARLRQVRLLAHLPPSAVAETLGIGRTKLWHWERGHHAPDALELLQLARLYRVPPAALLPVAPLRRQTIDDE